MLVGEVREGEGSEVWFGKEKKKKVGELQKVQDILIYMYDDDVFN